MTASPSPSAPLRWRSMLIPTTNPARVPPRWRMYAAAGVDVLVATCTDGSRGDIQNPAMEGQPHPKRDMAGARRLEMDAAAKVLGIQQRWLGFVDSGLPEGDPRRPCRPDASPCSRWSGRPRRWSGWSGTSSPT